MHVTSRITTCPVHLSRQRKCTTPGLLKSRVLEGILPLMNATVFVPPVASLSSKVHWHSPLSHRLNGLPWSAFLPTILGPPRLPKRRQASFLPSHAALSTPKVLYHIARGWSPEVFRRRPTLGRVPRHIRRPSGKITTRAATGRGRIAPRFAWHALRGTLANYFSGCITHIFRGVTDEFRQDAGGVSHFSITNRGVLAV